MAYDKETVKKLVCAAIDNVPDCAEITDCYTEHSYADFKAYITICVEVKEQTEENQIAFHDSAHNAFDTDMDAIS